MKMPPRVSTRVVIREPVGDFRLTPQIDLDVASSSQPEVVWQPTLKLRDGPLLAFSSASAWSHVQGGRVAQSLVQGLLLPWDLKIFAVGTDESISRRLQWHTIAVNSCLSPVPFFFISMYIRFMLVRNITRMSGCAIDTCS